MYAIVDIESTGSDPTRDRIIEIAILVHNGHRVIEEYATLINPQCELSPFIRAFTGISGEMTETAPTFEEVAPIIQELTADRIFVAHNVRFDYSFLRNEFKRIGQKFIRKQLCTVNLGRKILRDHHSYGLGRICRDWKIPNRARHRAYGDAEATAQIFSIMLKKDGDKVTKELLKQELRNFNLPPNVKREDIHNLPEETGVYYFMDERDKFLYIGKSTNIKKRILTHFSSDLNSERALMMKQRIHKINYDLTGNNLVALLLESHQIKRFMPPFNKAQRIKKYKYGVFLKENKNDYNELEVRLLNLERIPVKKFRQRIWAEEFIKEFAIQNGLCLKYCCIQRAECYEGCERCAADEPFEAYNKRLKKALSLYTYKKPNLAIIGRGREPEENSLVLLENNRYLGFGFLDSSEQISNADTFKNYIDPYPENQDVHNIIRSYLKSNPTAQVIYY